MRNLYDDLGVTRTAGLGEIRDAYRRLALELHPDRNPGDAAKEERFKEITHAYSILSDERQRARYDHELNRPVPRPGPAYEPPPQYEPYQPAQEKYRATKASFFYQYGKRKREWQQQQGFGGTDPFGRPYDPFGRVDPFAEGASSSAVLYTDGDPLSDPVSFSVMAPIDMGKPVPIVRPNIPVPGQQVPVMQHPQYGPIPVYFQFRRGV